MSKVDKKTDAVYTYLQQFIKENGFPPTVREIKNALGISSTSLVYSYIKKLTAEGKLEKQSNKNRALGLPENKAGFVNVPLVGTISAGKGILAVENIEDYYPLPDKLFKGKNLYLLRVDGNSMINAGISDGDFVVVKKCETADNGEIVAALIDENATVKRFYRHADYVALHPENPTMDDIIISSDVPLNIIGIVVGCIKQFN